MGLFGGIGRALTKPGEQSGLSLADRLAIFGTAASGDFGTAMSLRQAPQERAKLAQREAFSQSLLGRIGPQYAETQGAGAAIQMPDMPRMPKQETVPDYQWRPPQKVRDGLNINSPDLPALALKAQQLGVPISSLLDVLKAQQPDVAVGPDGTPYNKRSMDGLPERFRNPTNVNGWITDLNKPSNEGQYLPQLPAGVIPDGKGGAANITGLTTAVGEQEEATARGRTMGTVFQNPNGAGGFTPTLGRTMFGADGVSGGGGTGGAGTTQTPADAAYDVDTAKAAAAQYTGIQTAGQRASGTISNYRRMASLLDGLNTGKLTPAALGVASALSSLGVQASADMSSIEAANALASKLTLDSMGGSLGAGFSNADRSFVERMNPSIANTPQGRKLMIDFGVARAQREQTVAGLARQWVQKAGRLDRPDRSGKTFYDYLDAYAEANPLIPPR